MSLFDTNGAIFQESRRGPQNNGVAIFGVGYDGTASFRPGARFGPDAIRHASVGLENYSPALDADLEDINLRDLGNLEIPHGSPEPVIQRTHNAVREILRSEMTPLMLGGEHSISTGAVRAVAEKYPNLLLIQLDAHADMRAEYLGDAHNHACAMARCLDVLPSKNLLQVGIRSGTREEFALMRHTNRLVAANMEELARRIAPHEGPIYLTIDLDVFDPGVFPGTGTPEPGGIAWETFASVLSVIPAAQLVAADVMELAPDLDPSGCSSVLAAKVVREVALMLADS